MVDRMVVLTSPAQLLAIVLSVLLVTVVASLLDLLAGVRHAGVRDASG